ncbi:MAG: response regulator transcription factor [Lysobacteraceae bacterium]|nr:MAG: response regulator transcription factor [Xanthomonadaceae bacterium]
MHADPIMTLGLHAILADQAGLRVSTHLHQPEAQRVARVLVTDYETGVALARQRYLSESMTRSVADSLTRESLTGRETDVLQLLAQGCCNKSIARKLGIGVGTVKTHVKGVMSKLDATARTHAVVVATQRGLIRPGGSAGEALSC